MHKTSNCFFLRKYWKCLCKHSIGSLCKNSWWSNCKATACQGVCYPTDNSTNQVVCQLKQICLIVKFVIANLFLTHRGIKFGKSQDKQKIFLFCYLLTRSPSGRNMWLGLTATSQSASVHRRPSLAVNSAKVHPFVKSGKITLDCSKLFIFSICQ